MKRKLFYIGLVLLYIIVFIVLYFSWKTTERFEGNTENVVFIIPTTSRNRDYKNIDEIPLINTLYPSLQNLDITKYTFVVGIDDDDVFFNENINKLKAALPKNFHFHILNNFDKSYVCIVNQLGQIAIEKYNADYIYVFADDLTLYTLDFIDDFIKYFKKNGISLGHAIDANNSSLCTHPFIHRKHIDYLGYLYPSTIRNHYCDDWIHKLYLRLNRVIKTSEPVFTNNPEPPRYDVVPINDELLDKLVSDAFNKIHQIHS